MELNQLVQLKEIAECRNLSQAAEHLHISQPALSTMLKKLEGELGVQLFDRTRNRITINEAGELALSHSNQILKQVQSMKEDLAAFSRRDSLFKVAFCDPGPMWYSAPRFSILYPDYELKTDLYQSNEEVGSFLLFNQQYDLLITAAKIKDQGCVSDKFLSDQMLLSVPKDHPAARCTSVALRDCPVTDLARFHVDGTFARRQQPLYEELGRRISIRWYEDYFLFHQMIQNSTIPTTTTRIVKNYRDDGSGRVFIPIMDPEASITYYASYLKKKEPRLKPLLNWLNFCAEEYRNCTKESLS